MVNIQNPISMPKESYRGGVFRALLCRGPNRGSTNKSSVVMAQCLRLHIENSKRMIWKRSSSHGLEANFKVHLRLQLHKDSIATVQSKTHHQILSDSHGPLTSPTSPTVATPKHPSNSQVTHRSTNTHSSRKG